MQLLRSKLIIVFLAGALLYNALSLSSGSIKDLVTNPLDVLNWGDKDSVTLFEKRFDGLKKILPTHGVLGYIYTNDSDFNNNLNFFLTQYTLTPLIIANSPNHELVVGNFYSPEIPSRIIKDNHLVCIRDFGNGVMLFKKQIR
jgi:hypothetical protein